MKIYYDIKQGSPEWFELRKRKLTASHATAIGNNVAGLRTYVRAIVQEMISEPEYFSNKDTERGNELEPIARQAYEFENNVHITEVGFIEFNEFVGCSPDGLVGEGGIEIKARNDKIHLGFLLGDRLDSSTMWQIQMNLLISGRKWWDFCSYNPNFKHSLIVRRIFPDKEKFEKLLIGFKTGEKMLKDILNNEAIKKEL